MAQTILIADDNDEIREVLNVLLSSEGYQIIEAVDGEDALNKADQVDLIILDIMMPKVNGYQSCVKIREKSNVPILFLSAKGLDSDKTLGFSSGGDDYLAKPFSYNELTARVKALLRRYYVYKGKEEQQEEVAQKRLSRKEIELDVSEEVVYVKGKRVELTDIEYQILSLFMQHPRQIFSAQHLYETIWAEPYYYSANNTVMVHIRNLRKKIEEDAQNPKYIKTIWGKGYRFG
ncbi:MAG: response regulator transcription factor [Erysipelotrichia bacterium]|nr:response regulator transcription factor [Erysipelotrichia bacterium]